MRPLQDVFRVAAQALVGSGMGPDREVRSMSMQLNPQFAQASMRDRTAELNRNAERARQSRAAEGPRSTHSLRTVVVTVAGLICGVLVALQLG